MQSRRASSHAWWFALALMLSPHAWTESSDEVEARTAGAVWLLFGTLLALEQQGASQSWRWLNEEIGFGPEEAGTLLAFTIESLAGLTARADAAHEQNCRALLAVTPSLDDVARALERTNAELAAYRQQRVVELGAVLPADAQASLLAFARDELGESVDTAEFDFRAFLEGTGADPSDLVREMCSND
jgi:hypothetical protein